MESTLQTIERIESAAEASWKNLCHDDVYPQPESRVVAILYRGLPNIFHNYLNHWPKINATPDWDAYRKSGGERLYYFLIIRYSHWTIEEKFDCSSYTTDRHAFCKQLEEFAERVSKRFKEIECSGNPWWHESDSKNRATYVAQCRLKGEHPKLYDFTTVLAQIKPRGGRFQWFRRPTQYHPGWLVSEHEQGHAKTMEEAKAIIEATWQRKEQNVAETV